MSHMISEQLVISHLKRETPRDIPCIKHYWPPNLIRESEAATFFCQSLYKACEHRWRSVQRSTAEFIALPCGLGSLFQQYASTEHHWYHSWSKHLGISRYHCPFSLLFTFLSAAPFPQHCSLYTLAEKFSELIFCLAQQVKLIQSSWNVGANSAADHNWSSKCFFTSQHGLL